MKSQTSVSVAAIKVLWMNKRLMYVNPSSILKKDNRLIAQRQTGDSFSACSFNTMYAGRCLHSNKVHKAQRKLANARMEWTNPDSYGIVLSDFNNGNISYELHKYG